MAARSATAPFSSRAGFPKDHPLFAGFLPAAPEPLSERLRAYDLILILGAPVYAVGWSSLPPPGLPLTH